MSPWACPNSAARTGCGTASARRPQRSTGRLAADPAHEREVEGLLYAGAFFGVVLRRADVRDTRVGVQDVAAELAGVGLHEYFDCRGDGCAGGADGFDVVDPGPCFGA